MTRTPGHVSPHPACKNSSTVTLHSNEETGTLKLDSGSPSMSYGSTHGSLKPANGTRGDCSNVCHPSAMGSAPRGTRNSSPGPSLLASVSGTPRTSNGRP